MQANPHVFFFPEQGVVAGANAGLQRLNKSIVLNRAVCCSGFFVCLD
jgi:hypothetical protein